MNSTQPSSTNAQPSSTNTGRWRVASWVVPGVVVTILMYFVFHGRVVELELENANLKIQIATKEKEVAIREKEGIEKDLLASQALLNAEREKTGKLEKELKDATDSAAALQRSLDQAQNLIAVLQKSATGLQHALEEEQKKHGDASKEAQLLRGELGRTNSELARVRGELDKATKRPPAAEELDKFLSKVRLPPTPSGYLDEQICASRKEPPGCTTRSP